MRRPTDTELAYLAGIIDADGYITIQRSVKKKSAGSETPYHTLKVGITGARTEPHLLAIDIFGGKVYTHRPATERFRDQCQWTLSSSAAVDVLYTLLPFLRVKREQAKVGLRFQAMLQAHNEQQRTTQTPPYRVTSDMRDQRDALWKEMVALNDARYRQRENAAPLASSPAPDSLDLFGKHAAGRLLDGIEHSGVPRV